MNVNMWEHAATRENVQILRERGVRVVTPDEGYLACGMTGAGRLAGLEAIAETVLEALGIRHDFENETVLVTAGPTCEDLDPVRFLTNRSSGRMGYALAEAAARRGARVVLVSGPVALRSAGRRRTRRRAHDRGDASRGAGQFGSGDGRGHGRSCGGLPAGRSASEQIEARNRSG